MPTSVHTLATAAPVLATAELTPGPAGYAYSALSAAATARGWRVSTEERSFVAPRLRWRAMVLAPVSDGARHLMVGGTHGQGPTEEGALAVALARMLSRSARGPLDDREPATAPLPESAPQGETDTPTASGRPPPVLPAADQAVANQERDLASGEENVT